MFQKIFATFILFNTLSMTFAYAKIQCKISAKESSTKAWIHSPNLSHNSALFKAIGHSFKIGSYGHGGSHGLYVYRDKSGSSELVLTETIEVVREGKVKWVISVERPKLKFRMVCKENIMTQKKGLGIQGAVYKIFRKNEWENFKVNESFEGSPDDIRDGFIHLSTESQVPRVIKKYFSQSRPLFIAKFSNDTFLKLLKWEKSSSGELYPHLYNNSLLMKDVEEYRVLP